MEDQVSLFISEEQVYNWNAREASTFSTWLQDKIVKIKNHVSHTLTLVTLYIKLLSYYINFDFCFLCYREKNPK